MDNDSKTECYHNVAHQIYIKIYHLLKKENKIQINDKFENFIYQYSNMKSREYLFHRNFKNIVKKMILEENIPHLIYQASENQEDSFEYMDYLDQFLGIDQVHIIETNNLK